MEVLLEIMLRCRDRAFEQVRLYEENSDECKLKDECAFAFVEGWAEAMDYMIYTAKTLLNGDEEEDV